jgi:branched-chain amino acid transport system substrate-binding protein
LGISALAVTLAACSSASTPGGTSTASATKAPLVIGASISLTGDFADPGKAVKNGYDVVVSKDRLDDAREIARKVASP